MKTFLYAIVNAIYRIHEKILSLNDSYEYYLSDKQLHFLVIGFLGMVLLLFIYPLFKWLSRNHILTIAFIYVFTVIIVITFAIEIGQGVSGTGTMDFADIAVGLMGFLIMFAIFALVRALILGLAKLFRHGRKH